MKNSTIQMAAVAGAVAAAVAMRLIPHPVNFSPLAATALFGGAYLADRRWAFVVPLSALLLSDLILVSTSYSATGLTHQVNLSQMPFTYLSVVLTTALGCWLRPRRSALNIGGAALASSLLFFVISNFGSWVAFDMYPKTFDGLVSCYIAAIPFFRNTLAGDAFFTVVLFGGYALAQKRFAALREPAGQSLVA